MQQKLAFFCGNDINLAHFIPFTKWPLFEPNMFIEQWILTFTEYFESSFSVFFVNIMHVISSRVFFLFDQFLQQPALESTKKGFWIL